MLDAWTTVVTHALHFTFKHHFFFNEIFLKESMELQTLVLLRCLTLYGKDASGPDFYSIMFFCW